METDSQIRARIAKRIDMEKKIVECLIDSALSAGWKIGHVTSGGETLDKSGERQATIDSVFDVDECLIYFEKQFADTPRMLRRRCVYIVLGNDGYDAIADHSVCPVFQHDVISACEVLADQLADAS